MEQQNNFLLIFTFALRILGAVVCYKQAKWLNRDGGSWSVFGFFFPIIAMIWVYCLKSKPSRKSHNDENIPLKPFTKYYTEKGVIEVENTGERKVSINGQSAQDGIYQLNRFESIEVYDGKIKTKNTE